MSNNNNKISDRLLSIVNALPLKPGMRVLEIGCGPGVAAREIAKRIGDGHVLAIDRSSKAIKQAITSSKNEIKSGRLSFRCVSIEEFELEKSDALFDLIFAIRVGALDGRHPEQGKIAFLKIKAALKKNGKFFIDEPGGIKEVNLSGMS